MKMLDKAGTADSATKNQGTDPQKSASLSASSKNDLSVAKESTKTIIQLKKARQQESAQFELMLTP